MVFHLGIILGLFRSTRFSSRFHLGIILGLFRSTRFSSRYCGLPFAQYMGLGLLLHIVARHGPHIVARLVARLVRRRVHAVNLSLLARQLRAFRLLARSNTGAPSR